MSHPNKTTKTERFLKDFEYLSPTTMLGLIVVSVGIYSLFWIYLTNKSLEKHDKFAPESARAMTILVILPVIWILITYFLKYIIFDSTPIIISILEYFIWGIIFFLIGKYLFDFCESVSEITNNHSILWLSLFIMGIIGTIGAMLNIAFLYPLAILIIITPVGIQMELNTLSKSHTIRKISSNYYKR